MRTNLPANNKELGLGAVSVLKEGSVRTGPPPSVTELIATTIHAE